MDTSTPSPFVGRAAELDVLHGVLTQARQGATTTVVVTGEAGSGKTRLLSEFTDRLAPDCLVLWGQCVDLGGSAVPYVPIMSALHTGIRRVGRAGFVRAARASASHLAGLVPEIGPVGMESELGRSQMFEATAVLLEGLADHWTVVLVVEDVHWADGSSRDLLGFLIRSLVDTRILVLLSHRTDEAHRAYPSHAWVAELVRSPRALSLPVPPLAGADVEALVRQAWGRRPDQDLLRIVLERSDGIPLLVEEVARAGPEGVQRVPPAVRDLLMHRVRTVGKEARAVLAAAAVGGQRVAHADLVTVSGADHLDDSVRELVEAHLLVPDVDGYSFAHELLREAVLSDLLPGELRPLHRAWADLPCDNPGCVIERAHHWYFAGEPDAAFDAAVAGADVAAQMYAPTEEAQLMERVLELWDRVPDASRRAGVHQVDVLARAAEASWRSGDPARADRLVTGALDRVRDTDVARYRHLLIRQADYVDDVAEPRVYRILSEALHLCPDGQVCLDKTRALTLLTQHHKLREELTEARATVVEALGEAERTGDRVELAWALRERATLLDSPDRAEERLATLAWCRTVFAEEAVPLGEVQTLMGRHAVLFEAGRYRDALLVARQGRALADSLGLGRSQAAFLGADEAEALIALGRWDEALATLDAAQSVAPPPFTSLSLDTDRAQVLIRQGSPDAGEAIARLVDIHDELLVQPQQRIPVLGARADWELHNGRPDRALDLLVDAIGSVRNDAVGGLGWQVMPLLAQAAVGAGGRHADDVAVALIARARAAPRYVADAAHLDVIVQAELSGHHEPTTLTLWEAAARAFDPPEVEGPAYWRGYARLRWAQALIDSGDPSQARRPLELAAADATLMGAAPMLRRARALARRAHLPLPGRRSDEVGEEDSGLTARQHEVLSLLAEGRTNAQIADQLFISPKTVGVHVSAILRTLGVTTRTEAAALAHRNGWVDSR